MEKIDTTLGELVKAEPALGRVLAVKFDKDGGAKLRYHVAKLSRLVAAETKHYYDDRNKLVVEHGDNNQIGPTSPKWPVFIAAIAELDAVPVSIDWGRLTDAMVEPYADITAADLVGLGPLFDLDPFVVETA